MSQCVPFTRQSKTITMIDILVVILKQWAKYKQYRNSWINFQSLQILVLYRGLEETPKIFKRCVFCFSVIVRDIYLIALHTLRCVHFDLGFRLYSDI